MKLKKNLYTNIGWEVYEKKFNKQQVVNTGSRYLLGNGYMGYRGTPCEWNKDQYVGCFISDTYDLADGRWRELCNAPNGLYTKIYVNGEEVSLFTGNVIEHRLKLDLKCGKLSRYLKWKGKNAGIVEIKSEKYASYHDIHLLAMQYSFKTEKKADIRMVTGIDGRVWDLNGQHLVDKEFYQKNNLLCSTSYSSEKRIKLDVTEGMCLKAKQAVSKEILNKGDRILRELKFSVASGDEISLFKAVNVYNSNDVSKPLESACRGVSRALKNGYEQELSLHENVWEDIWDKQDIKIKGDLTSQALIRYNLYQSMIATPVHSDSLPIGARGLSCQAYQGSAFWDQEIFNMPVFLYTQPTIARNILKYRYYTLNGAREKAKRLGYKGAFYAWVSGKTGKELCPSYFFENVITGRKIHNHFNEWQIHVSPDIAYSVGEYYKATNDWQFIVDYGAEIIFEVARFLYSHAYFKKDKNRYEFIRLLGPDEYHENVDNNAYTNYMAQKCLQIALKIYKKLKDENPQKLKTLENKIKLKKKEIENWSEMAELIYLPQPDEETKLIEQFDGYFDLEDITPEKLRKRLIDPEEYWGWPNGIAVETQVIKQADVIQLFCLDNGFNKEVMKNNYDYYKQRTQHGSSLSPSAYAIIAANNGYLNKAYKDFIRSCTIDLYSTNKSISGGTFIGGVHTAACAAAWQIIVRGFAGFKLYDEKISFDPQLPASWNEIKFNMVIRGCKLFINISKDEFKLKMDAKNENSIKVKVRDKEFSINPGEKKILQIA